MLPPGPLHVTHRTGNGPQYRYVQGHVPLPAPVRGKHGGMYVDEETASSSTGPVSLWRGGAGGGGVLWRSQFVSV